jgi:tetratricopeptide (TPR) repeat protein
MTRMPPVGLLLIGTITLSPVATPAAAQPPGRPAGTRYALLVGVDKYSQLQRLEFPAADVTGLARVLVESAGYRADRVVLMTQARAAENLRFAPEAKKIRQELQTLLSLCEPPDTMLVALAGHGVQFQGEAENYFCPADANIEDKSTLVPLGEVYRELERCKAGFKLLLVDACRDDPRLGSARAGNGPKIEDVVRLKRMPPPGGVAAFFSCAEGERAFEHRALKHGVFFHFVIEGLRGKASDQKGQVDLPDLEKYVKREVKAFVYEKYGVTQRPEIMNKTQDLVPLLAPAAVHYNRGLALARQHDYAGAIDVYSRAIAAEPGFATAYALRSIAYSNVRQPDRAMEDAARAVRLAPNSSQAFRSRGLAYHNRGENDRAVADYTEALRINPKYARAYSGRGNAYRAKGDADRAIADYTEAVRLDPHYAAAFNSRGNVYREQGGYDLALADYTEAVRLDPKYVPAYSNRALTYRKLNQMAKAEADERTAKQLEKK